MRQRTLNVPGLRAFEFVIITLRIKAGNTGNHIMKWKMSQEFPFWACQDQDNLVNHLIYFLHKIIEMINQEPYHSFSMFLTKLNSYWHNQNYSRSMEIMFCEGSRISGGFRLFQKEASQLKMNFTAEGLHSRTDENYDTIWNLMCSDCGWTVRMSGSWKTKEKCHACETKHF